MTSHNPNNGLAQRNVTIACPDHDQHLSSHELFGNERCLHIMHNNERYQLRLTRSGKLVLTK